MSTRILLVDDHQIVRKGLRVILEQEADLTVVGEASTGVEAVDLADRLVPDVVLMDISLPNLNGIDATRKLIEARPAVRVIMLSAHSMNDMITGAFRVGAVGYLVKDSAVEELVQAVRAVVGGGVYISPRVVGSVVGQLGDGRGAGPEAGGGGAGEGKPVAGAFHRLTNREREVLQLMSEGFATKEVARHLKVSIKTAETHRRAIMEKLDLHSVAELTKYAIREGLTTV